MKKYVILISIAVLALFARANIADRATEQTTDQETTSTYIIHGGNISSISKLLVDAGVTPTARYSSIDAVSIKLTALQKAELQKANKGLRFFEDKNFEVASYKREATDKGSNKALASTLKFLSNANSALWQVENSDTAIKELSTLYLQTPEQNGQIKSISINGEKVLFNQVSSEEFALIGYIQLRANQAIKVQVEFDSLQTVDPTLYGVDLQFSSGEIATTTKNSKKQASNNNRDTHYPELVRANLVHEQGVTGKGVTVAIIDTGINNNSLLQKGTNNKRRFTTSISVLEDKSVNDDYGHGTHLASIIADASKRSSAERPHINGYNGIAPDVNLVSIKAFDEQGRASYSDILRAVDYVIENKDAHNIRVLNLSFSAPPSSYYWDDPLNKALMKAWREGITVVAAAGNSGPDAMTIGVPGNTPYVITVGAITDNKTPYNFNDDYVTSFSSAGPTYEGFVKPELVAPGGHILGVMDKQSLLRKTYSIFDTNKKHDYFALSGSSQSTAITTGIVALMLEANPYLRPDDIKCRLISTAKAATTESGHLAFSIYQQGAGLVDAYQAVRSTEFGCANNGMDITKDLNGDEHYIGPVRRHEEGGDYYIPGAEGLEWSGVYSDSQLWRFASNSQLWRHTSFNSSSQLWRHTSFSSNAQLWRHSSFSANGQLWRHTGFNANSQLWRGNTFNSNAQLWRHRSFDSNSFLNNWVDHE
ncbi:S8 family peptidase [Agaribacter flavus]|uniref:S8 family peptidase n=1 Tax=Agaribacter flavus TaxID=1902781 RepID=A0ABV7FQI7_9ALTE